MSKSTKVYQETTEWTGPERPNHVYVFTERPAGRTATAIAYVPIGTKTVKKFSKPMVLDLKGRTFVELTS